MGLPNFSNSMTVGRMRYVQLIKESAERQNPDTLVGHFIPMLERWRSGWLGRKALAKLRTDPFYYYLVARTKYYDEVFVNAINGGAKRIISIGCGADTRAYWIADLPQQNGVKVLECDQREAINAKQPTARRLTLFDHVAYLPLDLYDNAWPGLQRWIGEDPSATALVLMEGVSPYINEGTFDRFLSFLATKLADGSRVAFDFKLRDIDNGFGRDARTPKPFRLPAAPDQVAALCEQLGYRLEHMELSFELFQRLLPSLAESTPSLYWDDGLVRLQLRGH
jgi:methyltransferase (TIGR00027 family)